MRWMRLKLAGLTLVLGACAFGPTSTPGQFSAPSQLPESIKAATKPEKLAPVGVLPNRNDTLKFLVLGDMGTGDRDQYDTAEQMVKEFARFPFEIAVMVGDNMYGSQRPADYSRKFELPYGPLMKAGVKFYAALGNHDEREQRLYTHFNMDGKYYYTLKAPHEDVRFFFLESTYPNEEQLKWIDAELGKSKEKWKIPVFHHPLYSSGGRHGSTIPLRRVWEPLFVKHNVSVVLTGHDHIYERTKPQQGIVYFVVGSTGKLRAGDYNKQAFSETGFDRDQAFMIAEIDDDVMYFHVVTRTGRVVDSGTLTRRFLPDEKKDVVTPPPTELAPPPAGGR